RVLASLFLAFIAFVAGGCCLEGYHIGPQGLYNMEIRSVYVPMIEANTYRQDFGERLTEAIVKKISEQTPYRIANAKDADSVLTVKLTGETQSVSALNRYDDTRQKNVELTATAVWTDVRGVASANQSPNDALSRQSGATILSQAFLVPEMGQSTATAQQEAIDKLADRIVGLMETSW
ncbi:MAG: hypothetical protein J6X44_08010, partial [Thermoguttaceae bacterium]|nr:hypothetical protein [Thermoguttaceae bacterium]